MSVCLTKDDAATTKGMAEWTLYVCETGGERERERERESMFVTEEMKYRDIVTDVRFFFFLYLSICFLLLHVSWACVPARVCAACACTCVLQILAL